MNSPKTIFITGASTGIGKETAILFAKKGWNVVATMRTPEKGNDLLEYPTIKIVRLDVTDEESIAQALENAFQTFPSIDVLFNNAGYALAGTFEAMTPEQIKKQFDTNVFGVMNVTRAFLPNFRKQKNGTIITTTSIGGLLTFPLFSVYHGTKWALEGFMESLHYELRPFNIRVKNIEPGPIRTEFENAIEFVSTKEYDGYSQKANQNMLSFYTNAPTAKVVARKVWKAANSSSFRLRYVVGFSGNLFLVIRKLIPFSWFRFLVRSQVEKGIKST